MAREVLIRMTDDLDRSKTADEAIELGIDGHIYVIDLTTAHAKELRELLEPYLSSAHERAKWPKSARVKSEPPPPRSTTAATDKQTRREIRDWARQNGHDVKDRGYLPTEIVEAYSKAHGR